MRNQNFYLKHQLIETDEQPNPNTLKQVSPAKFRNGNKSSMKRFNEIIDSPIHEEAIYEDGYTYENVRSHTHLLTLGDVGLRRGGSSSTPSKTDRRAVETNSQELQ